MTKTMKRTLSLVLVIAMIFSLGISALAAAGDITLDKTTKAVVAGEGAFQLTATVPNYKTGDVVYWSVPDGTTAVALSAQSSTVTNGIASVYVTPAAAANVSAETPVVVTATLNSDADSVAACTVTVSPEAVASVAIYQGSKAVNEVFLPMGTNTTLTGLVTYNNGKTNNDVLWSTNSPSVTCNQTTGQITGTAATLGSPAVITATSKVDSTKFAAVSVTVAAAPKITAPTANTTYYAIKGSTGTAVPTLSVTATAQDGVTFAYQWYSKASTASAYTAVSGATKADYTPAVSAAGTTQYYCEVSNNGVVTRSNVYTVIVKDQYDVSIGGGTYVSAGATTDLTASVLKNTVDAKFKLTQTAQTTGTVSWSIPDTTSMCFGTASGTTKTATGFTATVYGKAVNAAGVVVTAEYKATTAVVGSATRTVVVREASAAPVDMFYNLKTSGSVTLSENDFIEWYQAQLTSAYTGYSLYSVRFTSTIASAGGSFAMTDSTLFNTKNFAINTEYYTKDHQATGAELINNIKFTAKTTAGAYPITFTCTGKTSTGSTITKSGTLYFCVTKGNVAAIDYTAVYGVSSSIYESDVTSVYATANSDKTASPKLTVKFVNLPTKGTLYGNNGASTGYVVRTANEYNVNATTASVADLGKVIYVPGNYTTGTDSADYAVYNANGSLLYVGTINFNFKSANTTIACGAEGHTFTIADFVASTDKDPIVSVVFTTLAANAGGTLYSDYAYGSGTLVTANTKYTTTTGGTITKVTYIPRANNPVDVIVHYTATTKAGKTITATINMDYTVRTSALKFNDVTASWAVPAVDFCSNWGIASGVGGSSFNPNGTMERGMLVTMLYRMAGQPSGSVANPFTDISSKDYYYSAVLWAYKNGIVKGTTATTFSPKTAVSRQDIASMLWRYAGSPNASSGYVTSYSDVGSISSYAMTAMSWAVSQGIMSGSNGYLTPTASGNRAQVAAMLHRYLAK